jgi:hypothetical protein
MAAVTARLGDGTAVEMQARHLAWRGDEPPSTGSIMRRVVPTAASYSTCSLHRTPMIRSGGTHVTSTIVSIGPAGIAFAGVTIRAADVNRDGPFFERAWVAGDLLARVDLR